MDIFNSIGNILGYLLWGLYLVFKNYGLAIIFFTIILKMVMFPMSIKQQKSMSGQAKLAEKQKEIQKRCGTDKQRYNMEIQKLYDKEGVNPASGCLTTLIPFPIMLGIYYSVIFPLQNTLHIAAEKITAATDFVARIPGVTSNSQYAQLEIIKNWDSLKGSLTMFDAGDIDKIESFTSGFRFLGLDLLQTPQNAGFMDFLWIIPVLSVASAWLQSYYMNKASGVKQAGCMKYTMYALPLMSAWWAFIMPAAVGFYWVISSLIGGAQSVITNMYFSPSHMAALNEATRFVTMEKNEAAVKPLPATLQKQIADKIESQNQPQQDQKNKQKNSGAKKKQKGPGPKNTSDYLAGKK